MATSYGNNGGTGERRPEIIVTTTFLSSNGDIGGGNPYTVDDAGIFVDGVTAGSPGSGGTGRELGVASSGARYLQFDFGVGASIVIDEFTLYLSGTTNFGTFTFDGSNDGSSWTTIGASFTLQSTGTTQVVARTNSTGYRYYRLNTSSMINTGGGSGTWSEIEFKIQDLTPQASRCSWFNVGGFGSRGTIDTSLSSITFSSGVVANMVDGDYTANSSHAGTLNSGQTAAYFEFDFGSGVSVAIDTVLIWLSAAAGNANGTWKLQGSILGIIWVDLESASNLLDTNNHYKLQKRTVTNITGYRYYRLFQTGGSTSTPTITEIEFRIQVISGGGGGGGSSQTVVIVCTG